MNTSKITIKTKNLYLEGITFKYKDDIFKELTPEIAIYMYPRPAREIKETEKFISTSIKENEEGCNFQIVILHRKSKDFLGCGGIHHLDRKTPELGIWIKKSAHGHGYGKEAIIALKKWADHNLNYDYLFYPVDIHNQASRRIPEFFGAQVAREYDEINMSGKQLHFLEYRIYPQKK